MLKWAGGKRWFAPDMIELWKSHSHRRLVEPFCGGMAITLALRPEQAVINDINPHLVNFYRWVQRGLNLGQIDLTGIGQFANEELYYSAARSLFNDLILTEKADSSLAAALFYYLNRSCFNGLCRFNQKGFYNVPFGRYKTINYATEFSAHTAAMRGWTLSTGDFGDIAIKPDDFIFADPPYDETFRQYSRGGFDYGSQIRLAQWLSRHTGPVIATNQATDRIIDLYKSYGFQVTTRIVQRRISCKSDRPPAIEMIATKATKGVK